VADSLPALLAEHDGYLLSLLGEQLQGAKGCPAISLHAMLVAVASTAAYMVGIFGK